MGTPLADIYFTPAFIKALANAIGAVHPAFNKAKFQQATVRGIKANPKLLDKMQQIRLGLAEYLPQNYAQAIDILRAVAPQFQYFNGIVFCDYVQNYGLQDWKKSFAALEEFTQYSTAEYAIRAFILADQMRAFKTLYTWAEHDNYHIRRLACEGCRPRLPWAKALPELKLQPQPILPILEKLKTDDSLYVRKSVANNINDISKDHPELILKLAKKWHGQHPHTDWILNHGCRTLLKQGERRALTLFNWEKSEDLKLLKFQIVTPKIKVGGKLTFSAEFTLKHPANLRIEYAIEWLRPRNTYQRKVFQIKRGNFSAGKHSLQKTQKIIAMTTRKYYPGMQKIILIINGHAYTERSFTLNNGRH
jgi:3-methyladenine DNA glycosylase AlkC